MFHIWIVLSEEPEAIIAESNEMETEVTLSEWPEKALTTPPVCVSQSITILSLLPDAANFPSDEKQTEVTQSLCPKRTAVWLPVIPSRRMISLKDPTAIMLFQNERPCKLFPNETVCEQASHPAGSPLTTLTSWERSAA